MATTTLNEVLDAIIAGMATVTNLSTTAALKFDYRAMNLQYSTTIAPSFEGEEGMDATGPSWTQIHRVSLTLMVGDRTGVKNLLANTATMIPLILAWFRANDTLGKTDVITCHYEALRWSSPAEILDDGTGVLRKEVTFMVAVQIAI
jgi:hypothetical protein